MLNGVVSLATPVVFGTPELVMLDLPQIDEDQPAHRPLIAAHASPWPGGGRGLPQRVDGWLHPPDDLGSGRGSARSPLTSSGPHLPLRSGQRAGGQSSCPATSESVTDVALFGGANALAVESAAGQWEIVQAGQAELIAPGRYRLTRLLRGQRGTEHAIGNPAPAGARVVMLNTTLASMPISRSRPRPALELAGRPRPRARSVMRRYAALGFTPAGRGLVPFAPVHIEQPWRTTHRPRRSTIRWTRRSRALVADAWEKVEVPLAEDMESYDVQIIDGAAITRTPDQQARPLSSTPPPPADRRFGGAPLGPGPTLATHLPALSPSVAAHTATVTLPHF